MTETEKQTNDFKKMIQERVLECLGLKITLAQAWEFYKDLNISLIDFTIASKGHKVPLAGQVTYEIINSKPSDKLIAEGYTSNYKFRVRQSTTLKRYVNYKLGQPTTINKIIQEGVTIDTENV